MFFIKDELIVDFANLLKKMRIEKGVTTQDVSDKTDIDISTLNKLERGLIKRINPLMLLALADYYNTNVIVFYNLLEYTNDNLITEYKSTTSEKDNDLSIPLYNTIYNIDNFDKKISRNINLPFVQNDSKKFFSFQHNSSIIIFYYTDTLKKEELGIFKINKEYIIAKYREKSDLIVLVDIFNNENIIIEDKSMVKIIGKVKYKIEKE